MSKTDRSDFSILETRLLWAISRSPSHGYALIKELNSKGGKITNGTLYPILAKFLKKRLISVKSPSAGERGKKVYSITANGRKELNKACAELCETFESIYSSFVCKSCGSRIPKKVKA